MNNNIKISPRCFVTFFFFFCRRYAPFFSENLGQTIPIQDFWCGYCTKQQQPPIPIVLIFPLLHWFHDLTAWIFVKWVNGKQLQWWNDGKRRQMHCVAYTLTREPWWSWFITSLFSSPHKLKKCEVLASKKSASASHCSTMAGTAASHQEGFLPQSNDVQIR